MADADPGSLERLHDIAVPPPVPWWPPAPGWWVLAGLALVLLGVVAFVAIARWKRNAYRRAAIRELDELAAKPEQLPKVAELVKRVALVAFPREQVAGLTGDPWLEFLDRTGGETRFIHGSGRLLESGTFQRGASISNDDFAGLIRDVHHWIRQHRC